MGLVKDVLYKLSKKGYLNLVKNQSIFPYYHIINDVEVPHIKHLYPYKNTKQFKDDLDLLLKYYKPLHPEELIKSEGTSIPKNRFLLTFDDGLRDVYHTIYPILKQKGISAIFFLNPDFIDNTKSLYKHDLSVIVETLNTKESNQNIKNAVAQLLNSEDTSIAVLTDAIKRIKKVDASLITKLAELLNINLNDYLNKETPYLTTHQVQEMIDAGFYFGGHTMSHPRLLELSLEEQKEEVINSINWVKSTFNLNYSLFAFPFTDKGVSKSLINAILEYDSKTLIFGNAGIKKDINQHIIQRFSLENPTKNTAKQIVTENFYKFYNQLIGSYHIKRP